MFDKILQQDTAFFSQSSNSVGALTSHLSTMPTSLEELFGFNLIIIIVVFMNITGSCVLALVIGWKLGLAVIFGALPPLAISGYIRIRMETKLENEVSECFSQSAGLAGEAVAAIRTVSSLALEKYIVARYQASLSSVLQRSIKQIRWTMLWYSLSQSIEFLAMALGFW
jgi:ATP-binding cassette subfamily B (MDR/TAP) protein 1